MFVYVKNINFKDGKNPSNVSHGIKIKIIQKACGKNKRFAVEKL